MRLNRQKTNGRCPSWLEKAQIAVWGSQRRRPSRTAMSTTISKMFFASDLRARDLERRRTKAVTMHPAIGQGECGRALFALILCALLLVPRDLDAQMCTRGKRCGNTCIELDDVCHLDGQGTGLSIGVALAITAGILATAGFIIWLSSRTSSPLVSSESQSISEIGTEIAEIDDTLVVVSPEPQPERSPSFMGPDRLIRGDVILTVGRREVPVSAFAEIEGAIRALDRTHPLHRSLSMRVRRKWRGREAEVTIELPEPIVRQIRRATPEGSTGPRAHMEIIPALHELTLTVHF
jgi:hypothetical protein